MTPGLLCADVFVGAEKSLATEPPHMENYGEAFFLRPGDLEHTLQKDLSTLPSPPFKLEVSLFWNLISGDLI